MKAIFQRENAFSKAVMLWIKENFRVQKSLVCAKRFVFSGIFISDLYQKQLLFPENGRRNSILFRKGLF